MWRTPTHPGFWHRNADLGYKWPHSGCKPPPCGQEPPLTISTEKGLGCYLGMVLFSATEPFSLLERQENPHCLLFWANVISLNFKGCCLRFCKTNKWQFLMAQTLLLLLPFILSPWCILCLCCMSVSAHKSLLPQNSGTAIMTSTSSTLAQGWAWASNHQLFHHVSITGRRTHIPELSRLTSKMTLSFSFSLPKSSTKTLTARTDLGP